MNLDTVATATEQMSTTIREIAKNATEAARIAGEARQRAADTNTIVTKLGLHRQDRRSHQGCHLYRAKNQLAGLECHH